MVASKPKVCVIVFPSHWPTNRVFVSALMRILESITAPPYLISGNLPREIFTDKVHFINIGPPPEYKNSVLGILISFFRIFIIQIKMSLRLLRISKNVDVVMFYLTYFYQLPLLTAKVLRKKTVLLQTNRISPQVIAFTAKSLITRKIGSWILKTNFFLADYIVPESESLAREYENYPRKVLLCGARYIDTDFFKIKTHISRRRNLVGYIGRLIPEKGVMDFVNAIPMILSKRDDVLFVVKGDGVLVSKIQRKLSHFSRNIVSPVEWLPNEEVTNCLNELKLLVLPSFSEGLPTQVLESMACGTPVLATPVGGVLDLIKDEETGFIIGDNSPEGIAENIIRALEYPYFDQIVKNARKLVEQKYTYDAAVGRYSWILSRIMEEQS